jgi:hypothetical protein
LLVVDSPIYSDDRSRDQAARRSAAYYATAGHPELAIDYHPASVAQVRAVIADSGFTLAGLEAEGWMKSMWRRVAGHPPATLLVGRRRPA